jgi:branched-subunit amino acid aminotransferase/4-amino-4-deoxychorismate lyase
MIWINGKFSDSPYQISAFDKLNLGMTVFTTMLAHKKPTGNIMLYHGRAHYARLVRHAAVLGLTVPYIEDDILNASGKLVKTIDGEFFAVRIQLSGGEGARGLSLPEKQTVFITASVIDNPDTLPPVSVKIERDIVLFSADPMNKIKSNYALRSLVRRKAVDDGFDDVMMMNELNAVTSSSVGNVIIKVEGVYKTPPLRDGVIDGIRRGVLLKSMEIREASISSTDLMYCDAAWIVNCLGVRAVIRVDNFEKPVEMLG